MPGCHHQGRLEVHHITWHRHGGTRRLANLVRLCAAHHRLVHRHHLVLSWGPDHELLVVHPDGSPLGRAVAATPPVVPAPAASPEAPWCGDPLDLDTITLVLAHQISRGKPTVTTPDSGPDPQQQATPGR
jgi:hypothetical protein